VFESNFGINESILRNHHKNIKLLIHYSAEFSEHQEVRYRHLGLQCILSPFFTDLFHPKKMQLIIVSSLCEEKHIEYE